MGWDWASSKAHRALLEEFAGDVRGVPEQSWWPAQLGEPTGDAVARLAHAGMLERGERPTTLNERSVAELKEALRSVGAKVGGKKQDLIDRLSNDHPFTARLYCPARSGLLLTPAGTARVDAQRERRRRLREQADEAIRSCLASGEYRAAMQWADRVAAEELWPSRTWGVDDGGFLVLMSHIEEAHPGILRFIPPAEIGAVRWAAAMSLLWGERDPSAAPDSLPTGRLRDAKTVVRMMIFWAMRQDQLLDWRNAGLIGARGRRWMIDAVGDDRTCAACLRLWQSVPSNDPRSFGELPHPGCTCKDGCRCSIRLVM